MKLTELNHQTEIDSFFVTLKKFLAGPSRNAWLHSANDIIQVYTRKGHHQIDGTLMKTLDVANIKVDELYQGKGIGTIVINGMHDINPFTATFVENLLNSSLYENLLKNGWIDLRGEPPCVYKAK